MPPGINTCITWSVLELRGLLEDEDTRVHFQRAQRHLGLHPFHLNDLNRAVREILDSNVNAYDSELEGFMLAYKNPKLVSQLGTILHDSCFIHVDVEADFYIFQPTIGCVLKGIANKKASNHIGVLVHKAFNVSIPKPDDCDDWFGDYVFVGQEVKFTVTHLDFKGKLPFVRGELISDHTSQSTYDNERSSVTSDRSDRKQSLVIDAENSSHNASNSEPKKKRSKKSRLIDSSGDDVSDGDDKRKVFEKRRSKDRSEKNDGSPERSSKSKISNKRKTFDSSSEDLSEKEDERANESKLSHKRQRINSESGESEDETYGKRKSVETSKRKSKQNGSPDTSVETRKPIVGRPNVESSKTEKSRKIKPTKGNEGTTVKTRESVEKEPNVKSLTTKKSPKKKSTKEAENSDTSVETRETFDEKPRIMIDDLSGSEKSPKKKKRRKENESSDTSVETREPVERKSNVKPSKLTKSAPETTWNDDEDSDPMIETEITIDEKSNVDLLKTEKSSKKKFSKVNGNVETGYESGELTDRKPEIGESRESKKISKSKRKKTENTSNPSENLERRDEKFVVESETTVDGEVDRAVSEEVVCSKKRSKKNRISETDNEDTTEFRIKSETRMKKKRKSKNHEDPTDKSDVDDEAAANESESVGAFEFIKPEIKSEHKKKRRKSTAGTNESGEVSQSDAPENVASSASDTFTDIRIKTEPDPSDVEDVASRENSVKRKKKHGAIKEENRTGRHRASDEETFFDKVGIKTEPDASDVEDVKPGKKKSKKKNVDKNFIENVKIKVEPNASDVEGSMPKNRLKIEPQQDRLKIKSSPRKNEKA